MLAQQCDMEAGELVWNGGDVHLYLNHAVLVEEQLSRIPCGAPTLHLARRPTSLFDYRIEDFEVRNYHPQSHIPARSAEHTSELRSLMRISYAGFCLKKKKKIIQKQQTQ